MDIVNSEYLSTVTKGGIAAHEGHTYTNFYIAQVAETVGKKTVFAT